MARVQRINLGLLNMDSLLKVTVIHFANGGAESKNFKLIFHGSMFYSFI